MKERERTREVVAGIIANSDNYEQWDYDDLMGIVDKILDIEDIAILSDDQSLPEYVWENEVMVRGWRMAQQKMQEQNFKRVI